MHGTNFWSCCRYDNGNAWYFNRDNGCFIGNQFYNSNACLPVSNYLENSNTMARLEDITKAYFEYRSNKRRSPQATEFELHWQRECVALCQAINDRTFSTNAYSFVVEDPKPREVFASDMQGRIVHHYIDMRIRPLLERRLSPHTYNNRIGMGTQACQNAVISDIYRVSQGYTKDAWVIKVDIKSCFPNINQDIAYGQLRELIEQDYEGDDKDELLYLIGRCIFSYPALHGEKRGDAEKRKLIEPEKSLYNKPLGTGAAIGFLIWQNAVNLYFDTIDRWLESQGVIFERFVDDFYIVTDNKELTLALLPELRKRLEEIGATLHPKKFYCQHWTKGLECLGVHIKGKNIYPNKRVIDRAKKKARQYNGCISPNKIDSLLSSLNSYFGICSHGCGHKAAMAVLDCIDSRWFRYIEWTGTHLRPRPEYTTRKRLTKHHHHGKKRNPTANRHAETAAA